MNAVSQWWIGGLRTRKAKVAGSIPAGGSIKIKEFWSKQFDLNSIDCVDENQTLNSLFKIFIIFLDAFPSP
jgi:hypothetical protein